METGLNAEVNPAGTKPLNYLQWRLRDGGAISYYMPASDGLQVLYAQTPGNYTIVLGDHSTYQLFSKSGGFSQPGHPLLTER